MEKRKNTMGLLTVDQLCKELSVSRSKIFNLRKEGALPFIKLGRRVLFSTKQVKKSLGL
ncbi:MAG: helix-turn-helix domain-containing protein [Candidatus Omnitrophica bacterium]|nr:helix-turn-helix domain-containing protein [Candidatus Omnitrophota bacterium]